MKNIFINARIVTPDAVLMNHKLVVEDEKIVEISPMNHGEQTQDYIDGEAVKYTDVKGCILMPGLIDIHSDMIENILQPRVTSLMDFSMGLYEAEKQLAACGITTIFHSVAMFMTGTWDTKQIRLAPNVEKLAKLIHDMKDKPHLINNYHHLRYELDNIECYDNIMNLLENDCVQLLSLMDHRPGQGQYKDLDIYKRHLGQSFTDEEFEALLKKEREKEMVSLEKIKGLMDVANEKKIAVASHDDDVIEQIDLNKELGIRISEFPITLEAAQHASELGMYTLLGAPNVLRGKSHSGNLSAIDAIQLGVGDILCSDYYPQALLRSVFILVKNQILSLEEAVKLVTLNPAKATRIDHRKGSLEVGKEADMIIVDDLGDEILMMGAYVQGNCVLKTEYIGR